MVTVKEIETYKNFGKAVELSNGTIRAVVTVDIGPYIIAFGYANGKNMLWDNWGKVPPRCDKEYEDFYGKNRKWEVFGGHRIWVSPEIYPNTYSPDDKAVSYEISGNTAVFSAEPETENGIAKSLIIRMDPDDANMQIEMKIKNISETEKEFAVWGITICDGGGTLIIPTNTNNTGYLPNRSVVLWPYTFMDDKRIYWGKSYITVTQDNTFENPLKIGTDLNKGSFYYVLGDDVFCKSYSPNHEDGVYADMGASFETYTNQFYSEIETLSELKKVKPSDTLSHTEHWSLCKKPCDADFKNDDSIDNFLTEL